MEANRTHKNTPEKHLLCDSVLGGVAGVRFAAAIETDRRLNTAVPTGYTTQTPKNTQIDTS